MSYQKTMPAEHWLNSTLVCTVQIRKDFDAIFSETAGEAVSDRSETASKVPSVGRSVELRCELVYLLCTVRTRRSDKKWAMYIHMRTRRWLNTVLYNSNST